jgi:hypothetical protein
VAREGPQACPGRRPLIATRQSANCAGTPPFTSVGNDMHSRLNAMAYRDECMAATPDLQSLRHSMSGASRRVGAQIPALNFGWSNKDRF